MNVSTATKSRSRTTTPSRKSHDRSSSERVGDALDALLANYFRDVGTLPVLQAEQEFEYAQEVEELEVATWKRLLSQPQLVEPMLDALEARLDERPSCFTQLRKSARALRRSHGPKVTARYERWCEQTAKDLRSNDVDRELLDFVNGQLRALRRGDDGTIFRDCSVRTDSAGFASYLKEVASLARRSQRVRNEFVQANLRLVVTIARRFNFGDIPLNDLIQEGNIGLIKAVGRYDHRRGFRFSTYASWWIRHAITRALADKGRLVRVPVHMLSTVHKVRRTSRDLSLKLGRAPTADEIGKSISLSRTKVQQVLEHLPTRALSLDTPMGDEDDRSFVETVPDSEETVNPADSIGDQQILEQVREMMSELAPMEADILQRRFGLLDGEERTLVEIGGSYSLSRERIRQIQERALGKLRSELVRRKAM